MKRVALHNLGCKVNAYETEAMQELLENNGYQIVSFHEEADIYIVNTCSVTNMADRKSRQMLHRARKQNPDAILVAAGCYVQALENAGKEAEDIDIVIGNNKKKDLIDILEAYEKNRSEKQLQQVIDIRQTNEYEELHLSRTGEHTRAYLKVQDGCNQFCSYCIIPYTRGRIRSRRLDDVLQEVSTLVKNGYKEMVLTGIHLSSFGLDTGTDLLTLIERIHEVQGLERIRLGSLEPRIITEEFVQALTHLPKLCPHFHLSLQSGCDRTLKQMNRRYDVAEYAKKCELLRKYFAHPALTTDIIVGFPGETEEDFQKSRDFVDSMDFYETHIFKYSKREGTKAAQMPDQVPEEEKTRRSSILLALNQEKMQKYEAYWIGKEVEVLFEEMIEKDKIWYATGHTREYLRLMIPCDKEIGDKWMNQIRTVTLRDNSEIIH